MTTFNVGNIIRCGCGATSCKLEAVVFEKVDYEGKPVLIEVNTGNRMELHHFEQPFNSGDPNWIVMPMEHRSDGYPFYAAVSADGTSMVLNAGCNKFTDIGRAEQFWDERHHRGLYHPLNVWSRKFVEKIRALMIERQFAGPAVPTARPTGVSELANIVPKTITWNAMKPGLKVNFQYDGVGQDGILLNVDRDAREMIVWMIGSSEDYSYQISLNRINSIYDEAPWVMVEPEMRSDDYLFMGGCSKDGTEIVIAAGCRLFKNEEDALDHWGHGHVRRYGDERNVFSRNFVVKVMAHASDQKLRFKSIQAMQQNATMGQSSFDLAKPAEQTNL